MQKILNLPNLKQTLMQQREDLLERLEEIKTAVASEEVLNPDKTDLAMASQNNDREMLLQVHAESQLEDIDKALERFEAGTYGICTACGEEIQPERLEIMPTAALCITCQRNQENK